VAKETNSAWYEALKLIFYLPYQYITFAIRGVAQPFKKSKGNIGLDL